MRKDDKSFQSIKPLNAVVFTNISSTWKNHKYEFILRYYFGRKIRAI